MLITAIDDRQDLFYVQDVFPNELINDLRKIPLDTMPFTKMEWQEDRPRRKLAQMPGSPDGDSAKTERRRGSMSKAK